MSKSSKPRNRYSSRTPRNRFRQRIPRTVQRSRKSVQRRNRRIPRRTRHTRRKFRPIPVKKIRIIGSKKRIQRRRKLVERFKRFQKPGKQIPLPKVIDVEFAGQLPKEPFGLRLRIYGRGIEGGISPEIGGRSVRYSIQVQFKRPKHGKSLSKAIRAELEARREQFRNSVDLVNVRIEILDKIHAGRIPQKKGSNRFLSVRVVP